MKQILVIIQARIGDTLLVTPALRAIKQTYPQCVLTVLGHHKRKEVLANLPFIDHLGAVSKWQTYFARAVAVLRPKKYDVALVYGQDGYLIDYALAVAKQVVAFTQDDNQRNRRITAVPPPAALMVAVKERLLLTQAIGVQTTQENLAYVISPKEALMVEKMLIAQGLKDATLVGLQLQSFPTKAYRDWPFASFCAVIAKLSQDYRRIRFVILGDKLSQPAAKQLVHRFPDQVVDMTGKLTLRQNAALIGRLHLYIGVDTGPTHLAGALAVPMVAMYHAQHPGRFLAPRQHPHLVVLEHPRPEEGQAAEMAAISVESVYAAATDLLKTVPDA